MPVLENAKCRCEKPETVESYMCGAFKICQKCKKVANWREFEG